jgi:hypothetical protein
LVYSHAGSMASAEHGWSATPLRSASSDLAGIASAEVIRRMRFPGRALNCGARLRGRRRGHGATSPTGARGATIPRLT